jgi:acetyl-CoA decarbonylase/synthase complex subunit delta
MGFEMPRITYSGKIKEIKLGQGENTIMVGGQTGYPFHLFESAMPNMPRIAFEVCDSKPEEWPAGESTPLKDVLGNPVGWAKRCVEEFNAEMICLRLASTDPNGANKSAEDVIPIVKEIAAAVSVPLIVWGCESHEKDAEVLPKIAEACSGRNLIIGPATDKNYKKIGAAVIAYNHTIVASTPIDVNLAKQLNILLGDLGVPDERIIMDPNIGGSSLGYGLEYTYTVMERARQAALTQGDVKLQFPMIANFATDVWKKKETKLISGEDPKMGDDITRGIMLEVVAGIAFLLAGADILVMRHPEAVKLIRKTIQGLTGS